MLLNYERYMLYEFPFNIQICDGKNAERPLHAHDYMQICYALKGECIQKVYNTGVRVKKGDIFTIFPYIEHEITREENKPIKLVIIDFMPTIINENMCDLNSMEGFIDFAYIEPIVALNNKLRPKLNLSFKAQVIIEQIIENMLYEMKTQEDGYRLSIKADLLKMLVIIGREYKYSMHKNSSDSIAKCKKQFNDSIEFINKNFNKEIRLEDAAQKAALSPTYYSYLFKQIKGKTYIEYLNHLRISKATDYLKEKNMNITEIALSVGFNNLGHFIKMFKQITGMTPSEYRRTENKRIPLYYQS